MRRLLILTMIAGFALSASAQSPVNVTVQRVAKKKTTQGNITPKGNMVYYDFNTASAAATLRITIQNITTRPIEDMVVRWGVVKTQVGMASRGADAAYGKEEKCSLMPRETKIIETETVEAQRQESQITDRQHGEKIRGHGVQVVVAGKTVWEEFMPPTVKKAFENLRPVGEGEEAEKPEKQEKPKKKK